MDAPADMTELLIEIVGWIGAGLILLGYALVSAGRIEARSVSFQLMNLLGAAGFVVNSGFHGAWPSTILNMIWIGIAAVSLARISRG
ncbi:MAG: CBU_0592 family membrane protein [Sandaracinobacter sp.]